LGDIVNGEGEKTGRPSMYRSEYVDLCFNYCLLGATDAELAVFFDVTETTVNNWKKDHPEFFESIKKGRAAADANVANRLYCRAMGYEHDDTDIRVISGEIVQTPIRKYYPPDTAAGIFWLKNRQKAKWRDKIDHEHAGADGGPIKSESKVTYEFVNSDKDTSK
jgi:hypothetical protein